MNVDDFEKAIEQIIHTASQRLLECQNRSNADWTTAIFTDLTRYAYDYTIPLRVWSKKNEVDPTINGFLYDFMVYQGETPIDIENVWVVLESEWSKNFNEIKYDFYKLIQSRSKLRVMIFQSSDVESTTCELIKIIEESKISIYGDRYLFAGWNDNDGFKFTSHTKG